MTNNFSYSASIRVQGKVRPCKGVKNMLKTLQLYQFLYSAAFKSKPGFQLRSTYVLSNENLL